MALQYRTDTGALLYGDDDMLMRECCCLSYQSHEFDVRVHSGCGPDWYGVAIYADGDDQQDRCCALGWNIHEEKCATGLSYCPGGWFGMTDYGQVFLDYFQKIAYVYRPPPLDNWFASRHECRRDCGLYFKVDDFGATDEADYNKYYVKVAIGASDTVYVQLATLLTYTEWDDAGKEADSDPIYWLREGPTRELCASVTAYPGDIWHSASDYVSMPSCESCTVNGGENHNIVYFRDGGLGSGDRTGDVFKMGT